MKAPALVSALWLRQQMLRNAKNLRILDGTWHLPNAGLDAKTDHENCRLPSSRFFDIDECSDRSSSFPHMLPTERQFAEYAEKLGISNDSHVVVYDTNRQFGLFSAPRVWWTFRVFGHNLVSVLDGGLPKWQEHDYPTISGPAEQDTPIDQRKPFKTAYQKHLVYDFESMMKRIDDPNRVQVGDSRNISVVEDMAEAFPDLPVGSIPQTKSVPVTTLVDQDKKQLKSPEELRAVFHAAGIDVQQPLVGACGMGVTASSMALAAHVCGNTDVAVYDGSWFEWGEKAPKELINKVIATC